METPSSTVVQYAAGGQLPAVLTAVVNVVNGSFRADAAGSLIVTRGFMGNLPVNFSTVETPLYKVQVACL